MSIVFIVISDGSIQNSYNHSFFFGVCELNFICSYSHDAYNVQECRVAYSPSSRQNLSASVPLNLLTSLDPITPFTIYKFLVSVELNASLLIQIEEILSTVLSKSVPVCTYSYIISEG